MQFDLMELRILSKDIENLFDDIFSSIESFRHCSNV